MFEIELRVAEGVNFPYYVMGKAQLRLLPFTDPWVWMDPDADPYMRFAEEYGAERVDMDGAEDVWYAWLSRTSASFPDDARESLKRCEPPLLPVAQHHLPEYLDRWPALHAKVTALLSEGPSADDLASALRRNEQLFGLTYPDRGREVFHLNHFPTIATQKPGPHFVFGLGCLRRPEELLQAIESEAALSLLAQILTDERVVPLGPMLDEITERDHYVRGFGSLLEAVNGVVRALERGGAAVTADDMPRKPGEQGLARIMDSLFQHRRLWARVGLIDFVCGSMEALARNSGTATEIPGAV